LKNHLFLRLISSDAVNIILINGKKYWRWQPNPFVSTLKNNIFTGVFS